MDFWIIGSEEMEAFLLSGVVAQKNISSHAFVPVFSLADDCLGLDHFGGDFEQIFGHKCFSTTGIKLNSSK
jgi:hypothetical protein